MVRIGMCKSKMVNGHSNECFFNTKNEEAVTTSAFDIVIGTEYSKEFDTLRKNRMITSFYKYGPIKENYGNKLVSAIKNLEKRLELYKETGNTEYLADIANFAMIEYMYPQHPKAHFDPESESPGLGDTTYKDIEIW